MVAESLSYFYLELRLTVTPNANFYLMFNWDGGEREFQLSLDQCQILKLYTYIYFFRRLRIKR